MTVLPVLQDWLLQAQSSFQTASGQKNGKYMHLTIFLYNKKDKVFSNINILVCFLTCTSFFFKKLWREYHVTNIC